MEMTRVNPKTIFFHHSRKLLLGDVVFFAELEKGWSYINNQRQSCRNSHGKWCI